MERGVLVGGLMVFGSFLLATLLNRSAMEEMPAPQPPAAPVTVGGPLDPPAAAAATLAPSASACAAADTQPDSKAPVTRTEQAAPDCPGQAD